MVVARAFNRINPLQTARFLEGANAHPEMAHAHPKRVQGCASLDCINFGRAIDPCSGSGHILVYAFDVLMQIYETQGYTKREAVRAILENNIYGIDIDERAYQLSYFSLMMKACEYDKRILKREIHPHIYCIEESNLIARKQLEYFGVSMDPSERKQAIQQMNELLDVFKDAKEYGSILNMPELDYGLLRRFIENSEQGQLSFDAFAENSFGLDDAKKLMQKLINQAGVLSKKFWITCTNPPYMGNSNFDTKLGDYIKKEYADYKGDLFSVMMVKVSAMTRKCGFSAMITQHSWMFLSSYEKLRDKISGENIINLAHLGTRAFDEISGEMVSTTSFVIRKTFLSAYIGRYKKLTDYFGEVAKEKAFLSTNHNYFSKQSSFEKIPGIPVAYWITDNLASAFKKGESITKYVDTFQGIITGDNDKFLRQWFEVDSFKVPFHVEDMEQVDLSIQYWIPYNKGGDFRKWYGVQDYVVNWKNGPDDKTRGKKGFSKYYLKEYVAWSYTISNSIATRYYPAGFLWDVRGSGLMDKSGMLLYLEGLISSKIGITLFKVNNSTLSCQVENIMQLPIICAEKEKLIVDNLVGNNNSISKIDWDSFEISWDFKRHPLISVIPKNRMLFDDISNSDLSECFTCWENECNERFYKLKSNEEELNRIFIDIYGLQDELTAEVEEKDVTVHKADLQRDIKSLLSYAVGCMFGRYSLSTEGLAYAGGEWDTSKYSNFLPDEDNVIPITDQKYMDDDIVERLCEFLKTVYGEKSLESNLDFIANALGGKGATSREIIRNYFLNDFFKDHCKTYQKRPIYWLFDSGKQNGFKALVYMHRWDKNSIGRVLVYLHKIQEKYEIEVRAIDAMLEHMTDKRQQAAEEQRRDHLLKQIAEIKEYDEGLDHMTNEHIDIDLDDGVKVNYEKVQTDRNGTKFKILAPIK